MSEWTQEKFGSYIEVTNGFAFKSKNFLKEKIKNSLPVLKIKNIASGEVTINDVQYHLVEEKCNQFIVRKDDILLALTGNHPDAQSQVVGEVSIYKKEIEALLNQRVAKIEAKNGLDNYFLYYFLKDDSTHEYLASQSSGSANQANISKKDIENMFVLLPSSSEQKAIASVLSSLDDKIDLLHRQNDSLEAITETLFRQWFIKEAQENWEEKPLSEIAGFLNGVACKKYFLKNEVDKLPVLKIKELKNGISDLSDWATTNIDSEYIIENGDVIFAWSASLMVKIWDGEKCILNQHLFKVSSTEYPKWFYYLWCKHHLDEFISISASHATTMGHIKRGDLDIAMVKVPKDKELKHMSTIMKPLLNKKIENSKQIKNIEELRNTLLPKLISGEVRVKH
jgi:type I restriction enzyme, S subunit